MLLLIYHGTGEDPVGTAGPSTPILGLPRKRRKQEENRRSADEDLLSLVFAMHTTLKLMRDGK